MDATEQHVAQCLVEKINREHTLDGAILGTSVELLMSNCLEM
jgi:hypothetical protein